jgi:hypothetical protein
MINRIISEFVGPFVVILEYTRTRTGIITVIFGTYLLIYALGLYQLRTIRIKTHRLIDERYQEWKKSKADGSIKQFFKYFYPHWETMIEETRILYILNKHDLWPVRKTLANVLIKIPLDENYVEERINQRTETAE